METYYVYVIKPHNTDKCYIGAALNFLRELERYISEDTDYFPKSPPERIVRCFTLHDSTHKEAQKLKQFLVSAQEYGILEPIIELFADDTKGTYIEIPDFLRTLKARNPAYTYAKRQSKYIITLNGKRHILSAQGKLLV